MLRVNRVIPRSVFGLSKQIRRMVNEPTTEKEVIVKGDGKSFPVLNSSLIRCQLAMKLVDGSIVREKKPFIYHFGSQQVIKGVEDAIGTMSKGEEAKFTIPSREGYGAHGALGIPPNSDLVAEISLISISEIKKKEK